MFNGRCIHVYDIVMGILVLGSFNGVAKGVFQLLYLTPEVVLNHKRWHNLLRSEVYPQRLKVVIIDEAHTVIKW